MNHKKAAVKMLNCKCAALKVLHSIPIEDLLQNDAESYWSKYNQLTDQYILVENEHCTCNREIYRVGQDPKCDLHDYFGKLVKAYERAAKKLADAAKKSEQQDYVCPKCGRSLSGLQCPVCRKWATRHVTNTFNG